MTDKRNLTPDEVVGAIESLTDDEWDRINYQARVWGNGLRAWSADDLLNEALTRLLEDTRHAPINVPFPYCVAQIVRSLADQQRKKDASVVDHIDKHDKLATGDRLTDLVNQALLEDIEGRLGADNTAKDVLRLVSQEYKAEDICNELGIKRVAYDSARKRIRRATLRARKMTNE